jgi:hypothetical protein
MESGRRIAPRIEHIRTDARDGSRALGRS